MTFKIHFFGNFAPGQVDASWVDSTLKLPKELRRAIESGWKAAVRRRGGMLFDGPMCRLESWRVEGNRIRLAFSRTSYKWFWGTNLTRLDLAPPLLANALGLSAALESADGYILFGRRNAKVACHPNCAHPFAGSAVDIDLFAEMRRELEEELNLTVSDIADIRCIGMAEDPVIRQPELVFRVVSTLTRRQIKRRLDRAEHDGIWTVRAKENAIARRIFDEELTPIGSAALFLSHVFASSAGAHPRQAIARAEKILPGKPVRQGSDPRWQAMLEIAKFVVTHPLEVWEFVLRWGKHPQADLRDAVATVLLEHLLADHFELIFPRVREAARKNRRFKDTLGRCNWIGEAAWPTSAGQLDRIAQVKRPRVLPRPPALAHALCIERGQTAESGSMNERTRSMISIKKSSSSSRATNETPRSR